MVEVEGGGKRERKEREKRRHASGIYRDIYRMA
jgi:hypothetical protein